MPSVCCGHQESSSTPAVFSSWLPPRAKSCRISREREAPIASRTAISVSRALARARSKLARFAQAISNTSPVVAISSHNGRSYWLRKREMPVPASVAPNWFVRYRFARSGL